MRTRLSAFVGLAGLVLVAGCVSLKRTPEARFFVLQSLAQPAAQGRQEPIGIVGVEAVRLPGHLDRPQLVPHQPDIACTQQQSTHDAAPGDRSTHQPDIA